MAVPSSVSFGMASMIRGYHEYKEIWNAVIGERLHCVQETSNTHDLYAVAVLKSGAVVGHLPRKISSVCSLFLRRGGVIHCTVTGTSRYSEDLEQGGLEIPCVLQFEGSELHASKAERLIKSALGSVKRSKRSDTGKEAVKNAILKGEKLNDLHINFAQSLLKRQFPNLSGFSSTLFQQRKTTAGIIESGFVKKQLQIIHCREDHWIATSSTSIDEVKVYDSVYTSVDDATKEVVKSLFHTSNIEIQPLQKQTGGADCGLFAIAVITSIAYGTDPSQIHFKQEEMRMHLLKCFEEEHITPFPCK